MKTFPFEYTIDNDISESTRCYTEITIDFKELGKRWLILLTPPFIEEIGQKLDNNAWYATLKKHVIIISRIDSDIIDALLLELLQRQILLDHTVALYQNKKKFESDRLDFSDEAM